MTMLIYEPVEPNLRQFEYEDYRERAQYLGREPMDYQTYISAAVRWNREYRKAWNAWCPGFGYTAHWALICELEETMCI